MKTIDKLRKFAEGGQVKKYRLGDPLNVLSDDELATFSDQVRTASLSD